MKNNFICILLILSNLSFGQTKSYNQNIWFQYSGKFNISKKINTSLEYNYRFANYFESKQQCLIRPSFEYSITKQLTSSIGYTYIKNYVYGNPSLNKIPTQENQFYLQIGYTHFLKKIKLSHRLRDEFRYMDDVTKNSNNIYEVTGTTYRNRLRYMITTSYPIWKIKDENKLTLQLGNELFMGITSNSGKRMVSQNRIFGGLNLALNKQNSIQFNYIHQEIWNNNLTIHEINPTFRISYITNINLYKDKKSE